MEQDQSADQLRLGWRDGGHDVGLGRAGGGSGIHDGRAGRGGSVGHPHLPHDCMDTDMDGPRQIKTMVRTARQLQAVRATEVGRERARALQDPPIKAADGNGKQPLVLDGAVEQGLQAFGLCRSARRPATESDSAVATSTPRLFRSRENQRSVT